MIAASVGEIGKVSQKVFKIGKVIAKDIRKTTNIKSIFHKCNMAELVLRFLSKKVFREISPFDFQRIFLNRRAFPRKPGFRRFLPLRDQDQLPNLHFL